ncbi:MAG: hypothetical protein J3K34DRAFT_516217 [Monoraphidium minutum]|nr:MAG: hypothetical protein J3K34DRAFT_516217 [Monoraphidium minutum]
MLVVPNAPAHIIGTRTGQLRPPPSPGDRDWHGHLAASHGPIEGLSRMGSLRATQAWAASLVLALLVSAGAAATAAGDAEAPAAAGGVPPGCAGGRKSVLIVGNSQIQFNRVPLMVESLLKSAGCDIDLKYVMPSGLNLGGQFDQVNIPGTSLNKYLGPESGGRPWDYIVLQDQSQTPGLFLSPQRAYAEAGLRKFVAVAKQVGAKVLLYNTAAYRVGDSQNRALFPDFTTMQDTIDKGYSAYKTVTAPEADIIRVGDGYRRVLAAAKGNADDPLFKGLYYKDSRHPLNGGTYIGALATANTIAGTCIFGPTPYVRIAPLVVNETHADYLEEVVCDAMKAAGAPAGRGDAVDVRQLQAAQAAAVLAAAQAKAAAKAEAAAARAAAAAARRQAAAARRQAAAEARAKAAAARAKAAAARRQAAAEARAKAAAARKQAAAEARAKAAAARKQAAAAKAAAAAARRAAAAKAATEASRRAAAAKAALGKSKGAAATTDAQEAYQEKWSKMAPEQRATELAKWRQEAAAKEEAAAAAFKEKWGRMTPTQQAAERAKWAREEAAAKAKGARAAKESAPMAKPAASGGGGGAVALPAGGGREALSVMLVSAAAAPDATADAGAAAPSPEPQEPPPEAVSGARGAAAARALLILPCMFAAAVL